MRENPKFFRPLAFAAIAIVLSACVELRSTGDEPATVAEALASAPAVVRTGEWNEFQVHVPAALTAGPLRRSKWAADTKTFGEASFLPSAAGRTFVDADVVPGEVYLYEWGRLKGGKFESAGRARLAIPLDLEIARDVTSGSEEARRLFGTELFGHLIVREVTIETAGRSWPLRAETVSFDHTLIRSFAEGSRAGEGRDGRAGGRIHLAADWVSGDVRFELRGESGGNGKAGRAPDAALRGETGPAGFSPPVADDGPCPAVSSCVIYRCTAPIGDGGEGFPGRRGYDGERGGNGGDSGDLVLEVRDRSRLRFSAELFPGEPGRGGVGGGGGSGGPGGRAGQPQLSTGFFRLLKDCSPGREGRPGPEGERGFEGASGQRGVRQKVCLIDGGVPSCG